MNVPYECAIFLRDTLQDVNPHLSPTNVNSGELEAMFLFTFPCGEVIKLGNDLRKSPKGGTRNI